MRSKKKYHIILTACPQQTLAHADTTEQAMKLAFRYMRRCEKAGHRLTSHSVVMENGRGGWEFLFTTGGK